MFINANSQMTYSGLIYLSMKIANLHRVSIYFLQFCENPYQKNPCGSPSA